MVQLISDQTAIRTTVFSHADGHYEFPKVAPGTYTLRIAKPKEFYPWSKEKVEIKGADTLDDITLLRVTPRRVPAAVPGDRGAAHRIGMAAEPARHRRRTRRRSRSTATSATNISRSSATTTTRPAGPRSSSA